MKKQQGRALKAIGAVVVVLFALLIGLVGQGGIARAATLTGTIENTATGSGTGQVQFTGSDWTVCGGCGVDTGNNSYTYAYTVGSSSTIRFSGGQAKIWGVKESAGGIASVTVDGVSKGSIDTYAASQTSAVIYDTGQIGSGTHTVTLTITGKDSSSSATVLSFDKADIYSADPTPTPTTPPATPTTTPPVGTQSVSINAGGAATGSFVADTDFNQGNQYSDTSTSITTTGVTNPAPQAVYQSCRWAASFTYTIPNLTAGASYTVRLHWAELTWQTVGARKFNVAINGATVLSAFDVYATAGYKTALVREFTAIANGSGQIVIAFTQAGADNPFISGLEVLGNGSATPTPTPTLTPTPTSTPGGAPGLSGAGVENPYTFGTFRGTPVQVWETWNTFESWTDMEAIQTVHTYFTGEGSAPFNVRFTGKLSFSQPLWANGESASNCASGGDDQHYTNIANALKNAGFADAFIRLGWEQNGDWFWWHATSANATQWAQCFQHAYNAFKSVSSSFVIAWNPNKSTNMSGFDTRTTYPGDSYVDVIAVDFYDMYPNYPDQATWDADYNTTENGGSPVGMGAYISFANAHGKPLAFPEWGLNTQNSFDNPFYITKMADTFDSLRSQGKLYWESYFNLDGCTFEVTDGCNPNASAVYVQRF
ncbi:MAG TPA: malectin domain-containing carbohydrate-binding protein [Ktedonobacteraceae bacterium]|nr:malectin domain-containing carbohydrate-binding protein [Ktedonobacteraceae bacterium]